MQEDNATAVCSLGSTQVVTPGTALRRRYSLPDAVLPSNMACHQVLPQNLRGNPKGDSPKVCYSHPTDPLVLLVHYPVMEGLPLQ